MNRIVLLTGMFLLMAVPQVLAQDVVVSPLGADAEKTASDAEMKTANPPDISEYDKIPPGILVAAEDAADKDADKENEPAIDTTIVPEFYSAPVAAVENEGEAATAGTLTMEQIMQRYRRKDYASIVPVLEPMVTFASHEAEELLGIMYLYGQGVAKDPKKARDLLTRAAEDSRPLAQHHLAVLYYTGAGLEEPDLTTALKWINLAIVFYRDGSEKIRAIKDRDAILVKLPRYERQRAQEMARDWLEKKGQGHLLDLQ